MQAALERGLAQLHHFGGINQLDVILRGDATDAVPLKVAANYLVPFIVSNLGLLTGRSGTEPTTGGR